MSGLKLLKFGDVFHRSPVEVAIRLLQVAPPHAQKTVRNPLRLNLRVVGEEELRLEAVSVVGADCVFVVAAAEGGAVVGRAVDVAAAADVADALRQIARAERGIRIELVALAFFLLCLGLFCGRP